MKLAKKWKTIAKHAWSVRLIFLSAICAIGEAVLPMLTGIVSGGVLHTLGFVFSCAALVSRLIAQNGLEE